MTKSTIVGQMIVKLTDEQIAIVEQFFDYSYENPKLNFAETAKMAAVTFPATPQGELFRKECKAVFDNQRKAARVNDFETGAHGI